MYPNLIPSSVNEELILEWRSEVLDKTIKPITWNSYIRHLKGLFSFAIDKKIISLSRNPFSQMFVRVGKCKRKVFTNDEIDKINQMLDCEYDIPNILYPLWFTKTLILTLQYTGIRRSQLVSLKIRNIKLKDKVIFIESNSNKNHDDHIIPIADILYPYILELVLKLKKMGESDNAQLFNLNLFCPYTKRQGLPMSRYQLDYIFKVISKHTDLLASPHRFRHTIATRLMQNPDNLYVAQKLLGHKDIKVTLSYIQHDVDMIRNRVNALI